MKTKQSISSSKETSVSYTKSPKSIRIITGIAVLSAIAYVLQFLEFPVPLSPPFVKWDLSDLPALIGAFAYGPIHGVCVEFVKNALQLTSTATGGIGELANFVISSALIFPAAWIYKRRKTKRRAIYGCVAGSVISGVVAAVMNYFVLLPLYEMFMPVDQVIASFSKFFPFIQTKLDTVLYHALPMNIVKSGIISFVTLLLYKRISPLLKGQR